MTEYQPGACNIGRDERRKRRLTGVLGTVAAVGFVAAVVLTSRPEAQLVGSFPLWFAGAIGFLQDRFRFCVGFVALARYDLSGSGGDAGKVTDADALRRDRLRALQLLAYATAAALVATAVSYGVGTVV